MNGDVSRGRRLAGFESNLVCLGERRERRRFARAALLKHVDCTVCRVSLRKRAQRRWSAAVVAPRRQGERSTTSASPVCRKTERPSATPPSHANPQSAHSQFRKKRLPAPLASWRHEKKRRATRSPFAASPTAPRAKRRRLHRSPHQNKPRAVGFPSAPWRSIQASSAVARFVVGGAEESAKRVRGAGEASARDAEGGEHSIRIFAR